MRDAVPAICHHDEGRDELGDRRAHIARAEYAQRRSLMARVVPARHIGDTDDEGSARQADAERGEKIHRIAVGEGQRPGGERGEDHLSGEDQPAAIFFGPHAEKDARQRTGEYGGCDEQSELELAQPQFLLDGDADDGEDCPDRETRGKRQCAQAKCAVLVRTRGGRFGLHVFPPASGVADPFMDRQQTCGLRGTGDLI